MYAMILAAGRGTRLRPLTDHTPKPMLPVGDIPLLGHLIERLVAARVTDIVINLHHLGEQIARYVETHPDALTGRVRFHLSWESELLETGGGIVKALPLLGEKPFLLVNGDIWSDFDFCMLPTTLAPGHAHIVVTPTPQHRETGDFDAQDGLITQRGEGYVYCGMALLSHQLFAQTSGSHFSLRDTYFELIEQRRLHATIHHGMWHDIGSVQQYDAVQALAKQASVK